MSTIDCEPYPEAKTLSKSNVTMWKNYMGYKMMDWPNLGLAINSFTCNNKRREQLNIPPTAATTDPAARPTPTLAARPPTQKQLQKAHVVILAAAAAAPPVAPPTAVTQLPQFLRSEQ